MSKLGKAKQRKLRARRTRAKLFGTKEKPRLSVFKSNQHIYAQLIDDEQGTTIAAASSRQLGQKKGNKSQVASEVGKLAAEQALKVGIKQVVFDRGSFKYHGRIKHLAEAARAAGLKF